MISRFLCFRRSASRAGPILFLIRRDLPKRGLAKWHVAERSTDQKANSAKALWLMVRHQKWRFQVLGYVPVTTVDRMRPVSQWAIAKISCRRCDAKSWRRIAENTNQANNTINKTIHNIVLSDDGRAQNKLLGRLKRNHIPDDKNKYRNRCIKSYPKIHFCLFYH